MEQNRLNHASIDRIYRLALLTVGSSRAATRAVTRAFERSANGGRSEIELAAALLPSRVWRWQPAVVGARSGLEAGELHLLYAVLAAASPAARLALGLRYLVDIEQTGFNVFAARRNKPEAVWPRRAADEHDLLVLLARAWDLLPGAADYAAMREYALLLTGELPAERAAELRAQLLADDAPAEHARAARDGLRQAQTRLATALPALFAGGAPAALHARLTPKPLAQGRRFTLGRAARLRFALLGAVVLLVFLVVVLPGRRPSPAETITAAAPTRAPDELVFAALHRFDALATLAPEAVLHERFAASADGERWTLERWYATQPPYRVRIEVRDSEDRLRFALATDGEQLIQRRDAQPDPSADRLRVEGGDFQLEPEVVARMLPILRQQPDGLLIFGPSPGGYSLDRYYLAQARGAALSDLGQTTLAGRTAQLISYRSEQPFPPVPERRFSREQREPSASARVVLAIDTQTYAVLEVRVLPGEETTGEVSTPWQAERYELLDAAEPVTFALAPAEQPSGQNEVMISPRVAGAPTDILLSLPTVAAQQAPLYVPAPTGEPSLSYALRFEEEQTIFVREGEHATLILLPFRVGERSVIGGDVREQPRQIGALTYSLIEPEDWFDDLPLTTMARVTLAANGGGLDVVYSHGYASPAEREAQLEQLLATLQPVAPANAALLAPDFVGPANETLSFSHDASIWLYRSYMQARRALAYQ